MAEKYLIIVDVQEDFVTGSLGTKEAENIVPRIVNKIKKYEGEICFTQDTHEKDYLDTQEGRNLPVKHCIRGTKGWEFAEALSEIQKEKNYICFEKNTFGSIKLAEVLKDKAKAGEIASIELVGLCTDICVVTNALLLKAYMPEIPIYVDGFCCAGVTKEKHLAALETMKSCQIVVYESKQE